MKALVVAVILAAFVLASAANTDKLHYHLHFSKSDPSSRIRSVISELIISLSQRGYNNVELHIHFDEKGSNSSGGELQEIGYDDDLINQLKSEVDKVKEEVDKSLQAIKANETTEKNRVPELSVETGVDSIKKGIDITQQNINAAIEKTQGAFNQVKEQIRSIQLPEITMPKLVEPIINISKLTIKLIPCSISLQKAIPSLLAFAKAASINNAAEAVQQLFGVLKYLPEICRKCFGEVFSFPASTTNTGQCAADIVGLTAIFGQFIVAPENVIMTASNLHTLVDLVPRTIAECTGAFSSS